MNEKNIIEMIGRYKKLNQNQNLIATELVLQHNYQFSTQIQLLSQFLLPAATQAFGRCAGDAFIYVFPSVQQELLLFSI
jgi:hypothetical protein